jgi:thioredoxin reductase (NADPH)
MELNLSNLSNKSPKSGKNVELVKLLIIGSGPAGLSAALYAARADLEPVVLAGMELGGQVSLTYSVENYPGFPEGIGGANLVELFQKQAERFGAKIVFDSASEVDLSNEQFLVRSYNNEYHPQSIIVATGASPIRLNVPGELEFTGKGVSYCATCDGFFFKGKNVFVVGGGDSALEEAIFLTRYVNSVTIVHRRDSFRAGAILQKRALENQKIKIIWNSVVTEIMGEGSVKNVRLKNVLTDEETIIPKDGIFIFVGHTPNTGIFKDQLVMDERGYLITDKRMNTNIPGVFAAGEVADPYYRQVITSAGMGAAAAMQAIHYIEKKALLKD